MAKSGHRFGSQAIPESAEKGHPSKFASPGGDEDIGLNASKYPEKGWDLQRIMLTIGIQSDDHLIALLEDISKPCPEGSPFSKIIGMFQKMNSMCQSNLFGLIQRTIIDNDRIDLEGQNLLKDGAKGLRSIVSGNENTDFV